MEEILAKLIPMLVGSATVMVMFIIQGAFVIIRERNARKTIEIAEKKAKEEPDNPKSAWDLARVTLDLYFNRNLSQINMIFWLSVFVMFIGLCVITWGIYWAFYSESSVVSAVLATVAGVLTEFIGATFLFVYRSSITQAITYTKTLERINSVGMAMQILSTMPECVNEADLQNKTKAKLVELLVKQSHMNYTTGIDIL